VFLKKQIAKILKLLSGNKYGYLPEVLNILSFYTCGVIANSSKDFSEPVINLLTCIKLIEKTTKN